MMGRQALTFFIFSFLVWPQVALAQPPTATAAVAKKSITIRLAEAKKLRLIRYLIDKKDKTGIIGLDGSMEVTIASTAPPGSTTMITKDEVQGFVFRPVAGGEDFVVIHSCQCVRDAESGKWSALGFLSGMKNVTTYADWGCSGTFWPAPPPGKYLVYYRTLMFPEKFPKPPVPSHASVGELVAKCTSELRSETYWKDAVYSNPVEVTLTAPVLLKTGRGNLLKNP